MMPVIDTSFGLLALIAISAYILGSIPFGMVLARLMGLGNLRDIGSGNIGATNVLRTGNKTAAALTLLFDMGKGLVAVLAARQIAGEEAAQLAGLAAFIGHCFPVWLKFKGGKGVATFFGVLFGLAWPIGLATGAVWLAMAAIMRYSSLSALVGALSALIWCFLFNYASGFVVILILVAIIFIRHRENIARLLAGEEGKIGQKG